MVILHRYLQPNEPGILATEQGDGSPAGEFTFKVQGLGIEGEDDNEPGVDVQYPWEAAPRRFHRRVMQVTEHPERAMLQHTAGI